MLGQPPNVLKCLHMCNWYLLRCCQLSHMLVRGWGRWLLRKVSQDLSYCWMDRQGHQPDCRRIKTELEEGNWRKQVSYEHVIHVRLFYLVIRTAEGWEGLGGGRGTENFSERRNNNIAYTRKWTCVSRTVPFPLSLCHTVYYCVSPQSHTHTLTEGTRMFTYL